MISVPVSSLFYMTYELHFPTVRGFAAGLRDLFYSLTQFRACFEDVIECPLQDYVMDRGRSISWPLRSPDLSPLEVFVVVARGQVM